MSQQKRIAELMTAVGNDPELATQFANATTIDEVVTMAAELGYDVTAEDVEAAAAEMTTRDVSEAELASLAGGLGASITTCDSHRQLVTKTTMYGAGC